MSLRKVLFAALVLTVAASAAALGATTADPASALLYRAPLLQVAIGSTVLLILPAALALALLRSTLEQAKVRRHERERQIQRLVECDSPLE